MKTRILSAAFAVLALASCAKEPLITQDRAEAQTCELTISIRQEGEPVTKAENTFDTELDYEKAINFLQLFVFDSDGLLRHYSTVNNTESGFKKTVSVSAGEKSVWAVANYKDLSSIKNEDELKAIVVKLEDNSTKASKGFVMAGSQSVNLTGSSANVTVVMNRLVGRIALASITNNLPPAYGTLTINRIFLSNVVGDQVFKGDAQPTLWYNQEGRMDESPRDKTHIINGSTYKASCDSLTYKEIGTSLAVGSAYSPEGGCLFYGMPNSSTRSPKGFSANPAGQKTVLVVDATINGETYYYPVVMKNGLNRNSSYMVYLTITDLGSDDPNYPPLRGSINVTVNVQKWDVSVSAIEETI